MDDLRALSDAATPGPWKTDWWYIVAEVPKGRPGGEVIVNVTMTIHPHPYDTDERRKRDAAFIVAAVNDVRARLAAAPELPKLRDVAAAAEFLVGSVELGEVRNLTLHAASKVNQALVALGYPVNDEGLIDWPALGVAEP